MYRNLNRPWTLAALASLTALALTVPAPAVAQDCDASWSQPYVCGMRLYGAHAGQRPSELDPRRTIQLAPGAEIDLEVIGIDQRGRSFPNGRMAVGVDSDRNCRELLDWDVEEEGRVHIRAGNSRGRCTLALWVPGNLNLEWPVTLEIGSVAEAGYSREQAEFIVTALYQGILGRNPDSGGLAAGTTDVLRGRLEQLASTMYASPEFRSQRGSRTASELLDDLYQGLLGRRADSSGVRSYLGEMERRRYAQVAMELLRSEEFEARVLAAD